MSHVNSLSLNINVNPPLPQGTTVKIQQGYQALFNLGYNMLVELSTASAFLKPNSNIRRISIPVWAHFDTGARVTTIADSLATHLGLTPISSSPIHTANGTTVTNNYAIDLAFPNTQLKCLSNLMISSCNLGAFNLQKCIENQSDQRNFGVLIGRDIMSCWNITWHGPTSTVFISD